MCRYITICRYFTICRYITIDCRYRSCGMQEVNLPGAGLTSVVKEDLVFFNTLRSLQLDNNRLTDMSPFGDLPMLRTLNLSCNLLTALPPFSRGFTSLQILDLSFNHLNAAAVFGGPSGLSELPGLLELDVSGNGFGKLPNVHGCWPSLRKLDLEYNGLSGDCLGPLATLPALEQLGLAHNRIRGIPEKIATSDCSYRALNRLDLSFNQIRSVPVSVFCVRNIG